MKTQNKEKNLVFLVGKQDTNRVTDFMYRLIFIHYNVGRIMTQETLYQGKYYSI